MERSKPKAPRKSRATKKPIADIECDTDKLRIRSIEATTRLMELIMTVDGLSKDDRDMLVVAASEAAGAAIVSIGFQKLLHSKKSGRSRAGNARDGKRKRVAAWHAFADALAKSLWEKKSIYHGNASSTAEEIHEALVTSCSKNGIKPPRPGTVAKYIATLPSS